MKLLVSCEMENTLDQCYRKCYNALEITNYNVFLMEKMEEIVN